MAAYVLTWNPTLWDYSDEEYERRCVEASAGERPEDSWSTGSRKHGILRGDRAILLRQNNERGVIAIGRFISEIYLDDHWNPDLGPGAKTRYADVAWDCFLRSEDRLPTERLAAATPSFSWKRLQGSGVRLPTDVEVVFESLWNAHVAGVESATTSEELPGGKTYAEGAQRTITVNRYERDPAARREAIAHHGAVCVVCDFEFRDRYGPIGAGFIHVHHVMELSQLPDGYEVDPRTDLVPVCANCHAMLHRRSPAYSPAELRSMLI